MAGIVNKVYFWPVTRVKWLRNRENCQIKNDPRGGGDRDWVIDLNNQVTRCTRPLMSHECQYFNATDCVDSSKGTPSWGRLKFAKNFFLFSLACSAGVLFERAICSRKRRVETFRREEKMGRVKGSGEGAGREKTKRHIFFLPSPSPLFFFRPRTYRKGYYFYSPQSSTVIKSKRLLQQYLNTNKVSLNQNTPALQAMFSLSRQ